MTTCSLGRVDFKKRGGSNISKKEFGEDTSKKTYSEEYKHTLEYAEAFKELSNNMSSFMSQSNSGSINNVKISDVQKYLQNPYENIAQIRSTATYLTNKHGILRDAVRMVKSLPTLKYSLRWSVPEDTDISEYEQEANDFLDRINVESIVRDGLLEVAELGTIAMCLRSKKYTQFLETEELNINKQRDGKWVVEYDLKSIDDIRDTQDKINKIESLPDEVTIGAYNTFKKSNSDEKRFIEIKNCVVVNLDAKRNSPYGLPMTLGAWLPILQKEVIDQVERSVSDRLVKQILILSAGHMDKDKTKPAPAPLIDYYFKQVEKLVRDKDSGANNYSRGGSDSSGTGVVAFPDMFNLEALDIDTTLFTRDLYDKIENDIYANLGISKALGYGEGGNYSSAQVNSEKIFSIIFSIVGQFESAINGFMDTIFPDQIKCRIKFDESTVMDKDKEIADKREVFMQTSLITPWLESVMNMPIDDIIKQRKHEDKLQLEELFKPAKNAYTSTDDDSKPSKKDSEIDNENTAKSRSNDGNGNPSPSD